MEFTNPEMCELTEAVIFTEPYIRHPNNKHTSPQLDADVEALQVRRQHPPSLPLRTHALARMHSAGLPCGQDSAREGCTRRLAPPDATKRHQAALSCSCIRMCDSPRQRMQRLPTLLRVPAQGDVEARSAICDLKRKFHSKADALLHGDLHTGAPPRSMLPSMLSPSHGPCTTGPPSLPCARTTTGGLCSPNPTP